MHKNPLTVQVLKPFTYQGDTLFPVVTQVVHRGCFRLTKPGGHSWFDRYHFIDPETDQPWTKDLDGVMKDAETGQVMESLEGYIQVVRN